MMQRVLEPNVWPPNWVSQPGITSPFGESKNRPPGSTNPHRGVDFNYRTGEYAARLNRSHPALRAPVTGIVTNAGEGTMGRIAIRDVNGFSHEILHTYTRHVAVGDPVVAGQLIGTMGETGVKKKDPNTRADHVHYQLRDPSGNVIDPSAYWDEQGRLDSNPTPPTHLDDYQQYLRTPGAVGSRAAAADPNTVASNAPTEAKDIRRLTRVAPKADLGAYDPNAPVTQLNEMPSANNLPSFSDRFGNWTSSPSASSPLGPYQPVAPPPQPGKAVGIITGQPMPDIPLPPSVWGLPDDTGKPGDEEWSLRRLKKKW
jgi:hypothetical protein